MLRADHWSNYITQALSQTSVAPSWYELHIYGRALMLLTMRLCSTTVSDSVYTLIASMYTYLVGLDISLEFVDSSVGAYPKLWSSC